MWRVDVACPAPRTVSAWETPGRQASSDVERFAAVAAVAVSWEWMISQKELDSQLKAIPQLHPVSVKKELGTLHEKLQPGEKVVAALSGTIDGSTWLVVATDRRTLATLHKLLGGESFWDAPYEGITAIEAKAGLLLSDLALGTASGVKRIVNIHKVDCKHFVEAVTRMRDGRRQTPVSGATSPTPTAPVTATATERPKRVSKLWLIAAPICLVAVCDATCREDAAPRPLAAPVNRPAETLPSPLETRAAVPADDPCQRALPILRRSCPDIDMSTRCRVTTTTQTSLPIDELGPGQLIGVGGPGPEWFLQADGTLLTVNGLASGVCKGLQDIPGYLGAKIAAEAPRRGDSAKTYEGTFTKGGRYVHEDCSEFEIRMARILDEELMRDASIDENVALRRAAKAAGLKPKTLNEIFQKVVAQCLLALTREKE